MRRSSGPGLGKAGGGAVSLNVSVNWRPTLVIAGVSNNSELFLIDPSIPHRTGE